MSRKTALVSILVLASVMAMFALGVSLAFSAGDALAQTGGNGTSGTDYRQVFLDRLAALLGIDRARLDSATQQAAKDVIDQAEKNGDLTKDQADRMRQRAEQGGWPVMWGHWGRGHFGRGMRGLAGVGLDAAANALGISRSDLVTELRDGKTLGEIADARGVDRQKVLDAVTKAYKDKLDNAVKNGTLTQQQADRLLQRFQSANVLDQPMGGCGWGWKNGGRQQNMQQTPTAGMST